jgi:hypothetical protein
MDMTRTFTDAESAEKNPGYSHNYVPGCKMYYIRIGAKIFLNGRQTPLCFRKTRCPTSALGCEQEKGEEKA